MTRPYFPRKAGTPDPLRLRVSRRVRFEEVDALGIVWHGRYPSYFEDARVALGERYGIGYLDFHRQGVVAPLKKLHLDYHRPLRFGEETAVEVLLHWSEAARLDHEFVVRDAQGRVTTTGYSVQLLMDLQGNLLLVPPPFFAAFRERWKEGRLA